MSTEAVRRTPAPPTGTYIGMPKFAKNAKVQLADPQLRKNLRKATGTIRAKRVARVAEVPEWEELRLAGEAIKNRTLRHLDTYLTQLEESLVRNGAKVHWARDAEEANAIVVAERDAVEAKAKQRSAKAAATRAATLAREAEVEKAALKSATCPDCFQLRAASGVCGCD